MIEQVISSNILHEATNLLKKQNKLNSNENIGTSFEDLFQVGNSENIKNNNSEITDITITFSDKNNQNNNETFGNNDKSINSQIDGNDFNKEAIKSDDSIKEDKIAKANNKKLNKEQKNEDADNTETFKNNINKSKSLNNKESIEKLSIKFRYGNIELKSDLDFNIKQKIKSILQDLKSGKIDENIANAFITNIIRTAHIRDIGNLAKNKEIKVEIKKDQNNEKFKGLTLNAKDKDLVIDKDGNIIKNIKNNLNNITSEENKSTLKANNKLKNIEKDEIRSDEIKFKDLKSDIKQDGLDNKNSSIVFQKDIILDSRKNLDENKKVLFDQVVKNTKIVLDQNQAKFSTMIRPENLGRIDFQFVVKDGKMNGRMILQNQEVVDFFKSNVEELKAVMQKSNVELENIEIILAGNRFGESANNNSSNEFVNRENDNFQNNFISKNIEIFEENNSLDSINYSKRDKTRVNILI